jgi:hypothetical protein
MSIVLFQHKVLILSSLGSKTLFIVLFFIKMLRRDVIQSMDSWAFALKCVFFVGINVIFSTCTLALTPENAVSQISTPYMARIEFLNNVHVYFNEVTHKVHQPNCTWVSRCTEHCDWVSKPEAFYLKGVPCKVCKPVLTPEAEKPQ